MIERLAIGSLGSAVREFFFLGRAERRSASLRPSQHEVVGRYTSAARRRFLVARELRDPRETHAALSLCRSAALLHLLAFLASADATLDVEALPSEDALARFDRAIEDARLQRPAEYSVAKGILAGADPVSIEAMSPKDARRSLEDLLVVARWLATLVEPRTLPHLRATRWTRVSLAALAVLGVVAWSLWRLAAPANLALNKPTQASSKALDTDPKGAVDGALTGTFGFHSQQEDMPWIAIDLQKKSRLKTIKVFGRGDCCFDQSIPLDLEVSDDGHTYTKVSQRDAGFSEENPWVVDAGRATARFVRLRSQSHAAPLVLGEIEVYGTTLE